MMIMGMGMAVIMCVVMTVAMIGIVMMMVMYRRSVVGDFGLCAGL